MFDLCASFFQKSPSHVSLCCSLFQLGILSSDRLIVSAEAIERSQLIIACFSFWWIAIPLLFVRLSFIWPSLASVLHSIDSCCRCPISYLSSSLFTPLLSSLLLSVSLFPAFVHQSTHAQHALPTLPPTWFFLGNEREREKERKSGIISVTIAAITLQFSRICRVFFFCPNQRQLLSLNHTHTHTSYRAMAELRLLLPGHHPESLCSAPLHSVYFCQSFSRFSFIWFLCFQGQIHTHTHTQFHERKSLTLLTLKCFSYNHYDWISISSFQILLSRKWQF